MNPLPLQPVIKAVPDNLIEPYEAAVDQAIAMCDGDVRGAVKALLLANEYLESELESLKSSVSRGYEGNAFYTIKTGRTFSLSASNLKQRRVDNAGAHRILHGHNFHSL